MLRAVKLVGSRAGVVGVVIAVLIAGCAQSGSDTPATPTVQVSPTSSGADEPIRVSGKGWKSRSAVKVTLRSVDSNGVPWSSAATFRSDAQGRWDTATAPISGDYDRRWPMGLIAMLRPSPRAAARFYFWHREGNTFAFTAESGGTTAAATFSRSVTTTPLKYSSTHVSPDGFRGELAAPASGRHPAVILLGGSEGGVGGPLDRLMLANHGYAVLTVAYFAAPGLPDQLKNIPLEYFERAIRWLRERPEVDGEKVTVIGVSRGSEAALLLGTHYPADVGAVVASVPSNVALCGIPGCDAPAWTFKSAAVPYTRQLSSPAPSDQPAAVIPVEQIKGPVMVTCGGVDTVWPSCTFASAIAERRRANGHTSGDRFYRYPNAGHGVGIHVAYEPTTTSNINDELAREANLPRLLRFLRQAVSPTMK